MRKRIFVLLAMALIGSLSFAQDDVSVVVRYGLFGNGNGILSGSHSNEASGDLGIGFAFEYGMPFYIVGKQNGLKMSISYSPLTGMKSSVTAGTDVDLLFGYWVRFPFGLSDFAFQPELDFGIAFKSVTTDSTVSTMDPKLLLGLSMRWNCLDFAKGNLEFELTPQFGVDFGNEPSIYLGGRLGMHVVLGKNTGTDERIADREGRIVDRIQEIVSYDPALKDSVSVYRSKEGVTICLESIKYMIDSYELDIGEFNRLDRIIAVLRNYDNRILVAGHCAMINPDEPPAEEPKVELSEPESDDELSDEDAEPEEPEEIVPPDVELSTKRAQVVADYLIERGVRTKSDISIEGRGSSEPRGDNNTESGRRRNSRIEIILLRKI